jgi:hypothetical protein
MTRLLPMLVTAIVACSAIGASAQQNPPVPMARPDQKQQQPTEQGSPGAREQGGMMRHGMMNEGMMGRGMMGGGMMREGMMGRGMMGPMMSPLAMRIMFALMDADGDGTVSLQEFQTAHERIFKAMDANKDGVLSLEEIQSFMRGGGTNQSAPQP